VQHHWIALEADRAFTAASRARRRATLKRLGRAMCGLHVYEDQHRRSGERGLLEIPLDCIQGTTEPNRAAEFDWHFRPTPQTRTRWQRIWMAFHAGASLPPITVVPVTDGYAIRDGHHRVSVAKALGAPTISAIVAG
jgi:hypothetical protein